MTDNQINYDKTIKLDVNDVSQEPAGAFAVGGTDMPAVDNNDRTIPLSSLQEISEEHTMRPEIEEMPVSVSMADVFILKGEQFEKICCLSENSGEAQVFLVRKDGQEYVLKVYYPNFKVNSRLLQMIRSFQFEMIVDLIDFGKTWVDGKNRNYELMEYLRGGTLQDYSLNGDFNQFRRLALQSASALAYCHKNGILHKDVKPSNYFFRDESHRELVLGDFGISSLRENDEKPFRTTQARTPIYAAPEMYADVIDGEVEITPAADYYSLGITLFALWLGENPMSANERLMMRQKNEGRLPRLNELPERVRTIIQGLTAVNQQSRWSFTEVERWFIGEDVAVDISSPFLKYKSFVVDPDRNVVAENVHELVPLLLDNERLAMNYLYSGSITKWLETSGNTKLSTMVRDIVSNKYPDNQKAGLMSAVYTMEPTYPYRDLSGTPCDDVHEIALALLGNQDKYALALQDPCNPLFLWLEVHTNCNVDRLRTYFKPDADAHVAVMRLVYEIDDEIPFLARHPSADVKDIVQFYGTLSPTEDDWQALCDGRMLSWMYVHAEATACESLRILIEGEPCSRTLAYKVLYQLDIDAAYDLHSAKTPQDVGQILAKMMVNYEHSTTQDLAGSMKDFTDPNGRLAYYAGLHGWNDVIQEAKRCFDLKSEENRNRMGNYDLPTALYRFCLILGVVPTYVLPNGMELNNGRNLPVDAKSFYRNEFVNGRLAQWLSVFYHEDPGREFSEPYSYEREVVEWLNAIGGYAPQYMYYRRYRKACQDTKDRAEFVRGQWVMAQGKERVSRMVYYALCSVWFIMVLFIGVSNREYLLSHPYLSIVMPVGGVSGVIMYLRAYFKGYGTVISTLCGAVGVLSSLGPVYVLKYVAGAMPSMFTVAILVLTALYMVICRLTDFRQDQTLDSKKIKELLKVDDVNTTLLDPLYFTFKTRSNHYKGSKFGVLDDIDNQVHSLSGESMVHYVMWSIMVLLLIGEFVLFSPKMLNMKNPGDDGVEIPQEQVIGQEMESQNDL